MASGQRRRPPSRADVARLAGVSPPTVSLVLNGKADQARVARGTQERVWEAARRLRYVPNSAARAMRGGRHWTIGIIARPPGAPATFHVSAFEEFVVSAIAEAAEHAHNLKFLPPVASDHAYDVPAMLRDAQVDGLLVQNLNSVARSLADWRVPVVYVGLAEGPEDLPLDRVGAVTVDEESGLRAAARHLRYRGHTRIGVVAGPNHRPGPLPRLRAFIEEFERSGSNDHCVLIAEESDWSPEAGYRAMRTLLEREPDITAVHAGNDWMATGVLRAADEAGMSVPDDLAIVGFGDFRPSAYLRPPLTTVRWPLADVGVRAVDMLFTQLGGSPKPRESDTPPGCGHLTLPAELIVRASTGRG